MICEFKEEIMLFSLLSPHQPLATHLDEDQQPTSSSCGPSVRSGAGIARLPSTALATTCARIPESFRVVPEGLKMKVF